MRVIVDGSGSAAWNMAVDEVLLIGEEAPCPYTLRLYGWSSPTLSLGYAQRWLDAYDQELAAADRLDIVRRPTGGRTVLHADEFTYALAGPSDGGPLAVSVVGSYRLIAGGLASGLASLGADVELARAGNGGRRSRTAACFAARNRCELLHRGRKLAGSAQRRRGSRLLQHGSLPLGAPSQRRWRALGAGADAAVDATTGIVEALGSRPSRRLLAAALARGIGEALRARILRGRLTRQEARAAADLEHRYRDPGWTRRR